MSDALTIHLLNRQDIPYTLSSSLYCHGTGAYMPEKPKPFRPYPAATLRRPRERRESACRRGYDRTWQRLAEAFLQVNPLCRACLDDGRGPVSATQVDHVIAFDGRNDVRRLDWSNLQALCHSCHSAKTARENR